MAWRDFDVILSAAKDLRCPTIRVPTPEILRCAQDDRPGYPLFFSLATF
jgi:hypothetical protein